VKCEYRPIGYIATANYFLDDSLFIIIISYLSIWVLLQLSNQHPYVAEFIGEPSAFSVNMDNLTEVDEVVTRVLNAFNEGKVRVNPYL
jgi:hypothetical protein